MIDEPCEEGLPSADRDYRPLVLYIAGEGRSGSTLLAAILGQHPDYFPVGELRSIWHAIGTNELCGCGAAFHDCPFWSSVGHQAFGGWHAVDVSRMLALDAAYLRHRFVARLAVPIVRKRHSVGLTEYTDVLGRLYRAIGDVGKCPVIVDSTKDPSFAFLLRSVPSIDLRIVHLVRDSRGVAYSWAKGSVERPEYDHHPTLRRTFMDQRGVSRAALLWDAKNALLHVLGGFGVPRMLLRYELLVSDPAPALSRVSGFAGHATPNVGTAETERSEYESLPHHTIGGNRIRFARGAVEVAVDEEWRTSMARGSQLIVGALTLPFLCLYGYLRRPKAS